MKPIKYKNYVATLEIDIAEGVIIGRVHGLKDRISFHTEHPSKIEEEFHTAVDEYLAFCHAIKKEPEKPYNGKLLVRTTPDIHRKVAMAAIEAGISQGSFAENALLSYLDNHEKCQQCQNKTSRNITFLFQEVNVTEQYKTTAQNLSFPESSIGEPNHSFGIYLND